MTINGNVAPPSKDVSDGKGQRERGSVSDRVVGAQGDVACACGCGQRVRTPDARGRPRLFSRGHNLRVDHPLRRPGVENWWKGRKHDSSTRAKIAESARRPKPWLRGERNGMAGRTGSSNPNWRGGGSPERQRLYASAEWKRLRRIVFARDGAACSICEAIRDLHLHHVKPWAQHPELRLDPDNLIVLCRSCHVDQHRRGVVT
jgi:HNH endonuclease